MAHSTADLTPFTRPHAVIFIIFAIEVNIVATPSRIDKNDVNEFMHLH